MEAGLRFAIREGGRTVGVSARHVRPQNFFIREKRTLTPANRQELFSKIKNNNWDCIILTHDQFSKIPQSEQTMLEICEQELQDVERSLKVLEDSGMADNNKRLQKG